MDSADALTDMEATGNRHALEDVWVYFAQLKRHRQGQSEQPATRQPWSKLWLRGKQLEID
jgi:hypothetical protein